MVLSQSSHERCGLMKAGDFVVSFAREFLPDLRTARDSTILPIST